MLTFRFQFDKTLQAACLLLRKHDGCMSYLRLLKLLYIADRELLTDRTCPTIRDQSWTGTRFRPPGPGDLLLTETTLRGKVI